MKQIFSLSLFSFLIAPLTYSYSQDISKRKTQSQNGVGIQLQSSNAVAITTIALTPTKITAAPVRYRAKYLLTNEHTSRILYNREVNY